MYRQVCTRIRVGVWGTSQAPTPVADRANSSIRLGSYFGRRCHAAPIPSAAPAFVVTARCDDKQIRSTSIASRLYPTSSGDIHDQATRVGFKLDQLLSRSPTAGPSVFERASGMPGISEGTR